MWHKRLLMGLLAGLIVGCAGGTVVPASPPPPTATPLRGRITFAGSTTVQPLADKLGKVFQAQHPEVVLDIAAGGSVVGIQAIHDGTADIGMSSRALKPEEAEGLNQNQIAIDVLAIIVNPANPVTGLTHAQLKDIYFGQITNWDEVGGPDQAIIAVAREKSSGTRGAFDEVALGKAMDNSPDWKVVITAGDVTAAVAGAPTAIGYVGFGNLEPSVKTLEIDGILPSKTTVHDGSYSLVRPLLLLTGPLSQPLAQSFIDFVLSPAGQQLVEEDGWVPATVE